MADSNFTLEVRTCVKCGTSNRYSTGKCVACSRARGKEYQKRNKEKLNADAASYRRDHKDEVAKYLADYYARNADRLKQYANDRLEKDRARINASRVANRSANLMSRRAVAKAWRDANKEHLVMYLRQRRKDGKAPVNKERLRITTAAWSALNKDARRTHLLNRRARKAAAGGSISKGLSGKLFKLQKGKCACCKRPLGDDYHIDHIMPLALGGSNSDDNVQLLRKGCNLSKSAKHPIDFMQSRGFLL